MKKAFIAPQALILLTPIISSLLLVFFRNSVVFFNNIKEESFLFFLARFYFLIKPYYVYLLAFFLILLYFYTVYRFFDGKKGRERWNYAILPSCFSISLLSFFVLISNSFLINILFAVNALFIYLYFRSIYDIINNGREEKIYSIRNLSSYGNFLAIYFAASSIYGLQSFLGFNIAYLIIFFALFLFLAVYQVFWANKIEIRKNLFLLSVICIVIVELAWTISFLTLSYYVLGLILAIFYYTIIALARFYLTENIDKKIIKYYIIFSALSLLLILATAVWI